MDDRRQLSPVEAQVAAILATLRQVASGPDPNLTLSGLIALLGDKSHIVLILVFSALNMIPGPPGYGGTVAAAIMVFAFAMVMGRPIRLPALIGERRIPLRLLLRMLDRMAWVTRLVARVSSPRLEALTGPRARVVVGLFVMALCVFMALPIPFINAVPNIGLSIICLAMLNHDGVGTLVGVAVSLLGLVIAGLAIWGAVSLALALWAGTG